MSVETMNPAGLFEPELYSQVAIATGSRTIYIAGQVAHDEQGGIIGAGNLEVQVEHALLNVGRALEAGGATFDDIAKLTIYVTRWTLDQMPQFGAGFARAMERLGSTSRPPASLIGVAVLYHPDIRVEIEAIAVHSGPVTANV